MTRLHTTPLIRHWLLPWTVLLAAALTAGLVGNALRGAGHLDLGRDWFGSASAVPESQAAGTAARVGSGAAEGGTAVRLWRTPHEFLALDVQQTQALANDALQHPGRVLVLDARDAEHYRAGHLPGAVHLPYFGLPDAATGLLPLLEGVEWLVVYCESVTCDDGINLCRALRTEFGLRRERITLFDGGIAAWQAAGLPLHVGPHPHPF